MNHLRLTPTENLIVLAITILFGTIGYFLIHKWEVGTERVTVVKVWQEPDRYYKAANRGEKQWHCLVEINETGATYEFNTDLTAMKVGDEFSLLITKDVWNRFYFDGFPKISGPLRDESSYWD